MSLKIEVLERMNSLAAAGLGLVAALAWNDAIQALFRDLFGSASGLVAKFVYAALITSLVVVLTVYLSRATGKLKELHTKLKGSPSTPLRVQK